MKIPDFISPIIAWRVWQWDANGLRSLNGEAWMPGKPLRAGCKAHAVRVSHDAPLFNCTCGIYGSKTLDHLRRPNSGSTAVSTVKSSFGAQS